MDEQPKDNQTHGQQAPVETGVKAKSHIIHFTGPNSTAIDLRKIEVIRKNGKSVFFHSATRDYPIEMADEAAADAFFPHALNLWAECH